VLVKLPVVAPAATVTDAGVVSAVLLSDTVTAVPPVGAADEIVTVQLVLPPDTTDVGVHVSPVTVGAVTWPTAIVPPVAVAPVDIPPADTAIALLSGSATDALLVELKVTETIATTPLAIVLVFIPDVRHVSVPEPVTQFRLLPAAVRAAPAAALIEVTSAV